MVVFGAVLCGNEHMFLRNVVETHSHAGSDAHRVYVQLMLTRSARHAHSLMQGGDVEYVSVLDISERAVGRFIRMTYVLRGV